MDNLIAFLKARLDDDEAHAMQAFADHNDAGPNWSEIWSGTVETGGEDLISCNDSQVSRHIVRHDPARVLADVASARAILGLCNLDFNEDGEPVCLGGYGEAYWDTVRLLAVPYVAHPDYLVEWAPELTATAAVVHRVNGFEDIEPVIQFVRAHGIDPAHVPMPANFVIWCGLVSLERCVLGEDGRIVFVDDDVVRERVTVKQVAPWPGNEAKA